jgi:P4 family phage/plasmid primase-like protien
MKGNTIIDEYNNFMKTHQIGQPDQEYNFMSMGKPFGKFYIPPADLDEFYRVYSRVVFTTDTKLYIVEKPGDFSPIKIDVDLVFNITEDRTRKYTPKMVKELISVYKQEIERLFDTTSLRENYKVFVFEKPSPTIREHDCKDGFHIMFSVISDSKTQQLLRARVLPKIPTIFGDLKTANLPDQILDKAVTDKGNWMVYGSCKPNTTPYVLTRGYTLKTGESDKFYKLKIDQLDQFTLPKMFRVQCTTQTSFLNNKKKDEVADWYDRERKITKRKEKKELERLIDVMKLQNNRNSFNESSKEPRERIEKLVESLNPRRANNYTEWMEVGWCLHNIDKDYLDIWINFSKKSPKFISGECEKKWDKFEDRECKITIGSLYYWVKHDNPDAYNELRENDVFGLAVKHMTGTHYDLACLMYAMFKDKFVCVDFTSQLWYKFDEHRWVESSQGYQIRQKLSTELVNLYNRIISYFEKKTTESDNEDERKACGAVTLFAQQISFKLKNETFKARVMEACKQKFFDPKFLDKLDADQYLLGFANGVYDFRNKKFRPGKPEDYISMSTGIDYIDYSKRHPHHANIKKFLQQIMPVKSMRRYMKRLMSTFLHGFNAEQKFNIFIGVGSNGKSVLINLIKSILGDYFAKIDVALITRKRKDANSASPELAKMKGKRLCVFDEPNHNEPLNLGIMKILSGADSITARKLFGPPIEFTPQCKLVLLTNHLPIIQQGDNGVWRRISVTEFMSRFRDHPNPEREFEFKIDRTLNEQLKDWREHFMSMLIHIYTNKYTTHGITEPEEVIKYNKRYEEKSDHYKKFLSESTKKVKDKTKCIKLNVLYGELKIWYRNAFPNNKDCPTRSDLTEYLMDNFDTDTYDVQKRKLCGFVILDDTDDTDDTDTGVK